MREFGDDGYTVFTDLFALSMDYCLTPQPSRDDPLQVEAYRCDQTFGLALPPYCSALPRPTLAWAESRIDRLTQVQVVFWALHPVDPGRTAYDMLPYAYLQSDLQARTVRLMGLVDWTSVLMHTWESVRLPYDWGDFAFEVPRAEAALNAVLEVCSDKVRAMPLTDQHIDALRRLGPSAAAIVDEEVRKGTRHQFVRSSAFELIGMHTLNVRSRFCSAENWTRPMQPIPVSAPWVQ